MYTMRVRTLLYLKIFHELYIAGGGFRKVRTDISPHVKWITNVRTVRYHMLRSQIHISYLRSKNTICTLLYYIDPLFLADQYSWTVLVPTASHVAGHFFYLANTSACHCSLENGLPNDLFNCIVRTFVKTMEEAAWHTVIQSHNIS